MGIADDAIKASDGSGLSRLLKRKLPTVVHHLRAVEPEVERAARAAAQKARDARDDAEMSLDDDQADQVAAAQAVLDEANAALAACYEPVTIQALPPEEYEDLVGAHPAKDKDEPFDVEAVSPELFYRGVQGDLMREEWVGILTSQVSQAERLGLFGDALTVNARAVSGDIPKG